MQAELEPQSATPLLARRGRLALRSVVRTEAFRGPIQISLQNVAKTSGLVTRHISLKQAQQGFIALRQIREVCTLARRSTHSSTSPGTTSRSSGKSKSYQNKLEIRPRCCAHLLHHHHHRPLGYFAFGSSSFTQCQLLWFFFFYISRTSSIFSMGEKLLQLPTSQTYFSQT